MEKLKIVAPRKIIVGYCLRDYYDYDYTNEIHNKRQYLLGFATFMDGNLKRKEKSWEQWQQIKTAFTFDVND